jgi:hypothetical protein
MEACPCPRAVAMLAAGLPRVWILILLLMHVTDNLAKGMDLHAIELFAGDRSVSRALSRQLACQPT